MILIREVKVGVEDGGVFIIRRQICIQLNFNSFTQKNPRSFDIRILLVWRLVFSRRFLFRVGGKSLLGAVGDVLVLITGDCHHREAHL